MAARTRILIRLRSPLLRLPKVEHDHVVGFVGRVYRAAYFGHPERDAVVLEQRVGVAELVAVERPLRLPHHHRIEPAIRVGQGGQQLAGLGAALRWDRAGLVDVEELHDDHAAVRFDQRVAACVLPGAGGLGVLAVFGGYPLPGRESDHRVCHIIPSFPCRSLTGRGGLSLAGLPPGGVARRVL